MFRVQGLGGPQYRPLSSQTCSNTGSTDFLEGAPVKRLESNEGAIEGSRITSMIILNFSTCLVKCFRVEVPQINLQMRQVISETSLASLAS